MLANRIAIPIAWSTAAALAPCQEATPPASKTIVTAPPASAPFARSRTARDGDRHRMLLRQFRADEPRLGDRHEAGRREAMAEYGEQRDLPAAHWVWVRPHWYLFRDGPGDEVVPQSWSPEQACGEPDTKEPGDRPSAWATLEQDAADEWLLLEYATAVRAARLDVHENLCPGAVARVTVFDDEGGEIEVWRAVEVGATKEPARVLRIDLPLGFVVERVRLHLRSDAVTGWNEIDAVGLRDVKGTMHWAARAEASSTYASAGQGKRFQRAPAAPKADAAPVPAGPVRLHPTPARDGAAIERLEARIRELEQELARLRADLEKARAGGER